MAKRVLVPRTRNGGTQTQAGHMNNIRSMLRNLSRWWKPVQMALKEASTTFMVGRSKRVMYLCAKCSKLHERKNVEVNHIEPAGSLKDYNDLAAFCERLFVEDISKLEVLCKPCHLEITKKQRNKIDEL
jgi:DNA-directed RNA polymerase subunit RPC12/RpoP